MKTNINIRVEFESTPIRNIAIQCPHCQNWFRGYDFVKDVDDLQYSHLIDMNKYVCPMCNGEFGDNNREYSYNIEELNDENKIYKDCKTKRTTWE